METGAIPAAFRLSGYKIKSFSLTEQSANSGELLLHFEPSGLLNEAQKIYTLNLELQVLLNTGATDAALEPELAKATLEATFEFKDPIALAEVPGYFYANALAIVYPYLRAFMSTLSQQANIKMIMLPVMNLTGMENDLKARTAAV